MTESIGQRRLESYGVRPPDWLLGCVLPRVWNLSWTDQGDWSFDAVLCEVRAKKDTGERTIFVEACARHERQRQEEAARREAEAAREAMRLEIQQHNERVLAKARADGEKEAAKRAALWETAFKEIAIVWGRPLNAREKRRLMGE